MSSTCSTLRVINPVSEGWFNLIRFEFDSIWQLSSFFDRPWCVLKLCFFLRCVSGIEPDEDEMVDAAQGFPAWPIPQSNCDWLGLRLSLPGCPRPRFAKVAFLEQVLRRSYSEELG